MPFRASQSQAIDWDSSDEDLTLPKKIQLTQDDECANFEHSSNRPIVERANELCHISSKRLNFEKSSLKKDAMKKLARYDTFLNVNKGKENGGIFLECAPCPPPPPDRQFSLFCHTCIIYQLEREVNF